MTGVQTCALPICPVYHSPEDLLINCDVDYCAEITKVACGMLVHVDMVPTSVNELTIRNTGDGESVDLFYNSDISADFSTYKIYLGQVSGTYDQTFETTEDQYTITGLENGTEYFIGVSIADTDGNESLITEFSKTVVDMSLDQGILIVDDAEGGFNDPEETDIDNFYYTLFNNIDVITTEYDATENGKIPLDQMGAYSTVLWHINKAMTNNVIHENKEELKDYLYGGGNLILTADKPTISIEHIIYEYPVTFDEASFTREWLKIDSTDLDRTARFIGACPAENSEMDSLYADTLKTENSLDNHLKDVEALYASADAQTIYLYDTYFEEGSPYSTMKDMPVGIAYFGDDYNAVTLSFPLYYIKENQSKRLIINLLEEFGYDTYIPGANKEMSAEYLHVMPNPVSDITSLKFFNNRISHVDISLYNISGAIMEKIFSGKCSRGENIITFNAQGITPGIYFIRIKSDDFIVNQKIIIK